MIAADVDGDGYGDAVSTQGACSQPSGYVADDTDCDDADAAVNPVATEVCNSINDDCAGIIDDADIPMGRIVRLDDVVTMLHTNDTHSQIDPFPMDGRRNQGLGGVG